MGFYLRRSVGFGPLRLNLSKGGLGISAGITGARIGLNANGRAYLHAGRYGLYYRKTLSGGAPPAGRPGGHPEGRRSPLEIEVPTDATYPVQRTGDSAIPEPDGLLEEPPSLPLPENRWLWPGIGAAAGALLWLAASDTPWSVLGALLLVTSVGFGAAGYVRRRSQRRALEGFQKRIATLLDRAPLPDPGSLEELRRAIREAPIPEAEREREPRRIYQALIRAAIEDGRIDEAEQKRLEAVATHLGLDAGFLLQAKQAAFHAAALEALADHQLSREEEEALEGIRERLQIPEAAIHADLQLLEELRALRTIREGNLPRIDSGERLREGELCHYASEARLLASRVLDRHQRGGRKTVVRGLVAKKKGRLLITSQRLLLVQAGSLSLPFQKLLDLEVDADRNLLILTREDRVHPLLVSVPNAVRAGAILAVAADL